MEENEKELTPNERVALGGSMMLAMVIVISTCVTCFSALEKRNRAIEAEKAASTNDINVLLDKSLVDISNKLFSADSPEIRPSDFR